MTFKRGILLCWAPGSFFLPVPALNSSLLCKITFQREKRCVNAKSLSKVISTTMRPNKEPQPGKPHSSANSFVMPCKLILITTNLCFSDRLDVSECMNHKWLAGDAKEQLSDAFAPEILLAVQTITTDENTTSVPTENKSEDQLTDEMPPQASDEDKENSVRHSDNVDKSPSMNINHSSPPIVATKLVLDKSLSISLFPDAPTTPKVSRKMVFEDEDDLKEIVKKYQTTECQPQPPQAFPCCDRESSGECIFCKPQKTPAKPPSIELDKGIIC